MIWVTFIKFNVSLQCSHTNFKERAMFKNKFFTLFLLTCVLLSACGAPQSQQAFGQQAIQLNAVPNQPVIIGQDGNSAPVNPGVAQAAPNSAAHTSAVDLTHLELGDGKASTSPQVGFVFSCMTSFNGGGASGTGSWMNGDGTWDATKKAVVDGSVSWPHSFAITVQGDQRVFTGNDLPDHPTGTYPVSRSDDAYAVDRNPNSIQAQTVKFSVPANPTAATQPNCVGGEVGIMLSGVLVFSAFDAEGRDAVAHEVQDNCDGHPQRTGFYHYHSLSDCIQDTSTSGHSALVGYAFDGYGIYGYYGEDGAEVTNADLDVCHGHTHVIEWNGQMVEMYHYHATHEFPYTVGCFHGTPAVRGVSNENQGGGMFGSGQGQQPGATQGGQPAMGAQGGAQGQQSPMTGQGNGMRQPPQAALNACANQSQGAACSFSTPNGTISGTCLTPPNQSALLCVPAGGPPSP
jgi:hypothetical protein